MSSKTYRRILGSDAWPARAGEETTPETGYGSALAYALRAPDPGLAQQGLRFVLAGSTVALIYLATTTMLADLAGLPFQAALAIGFCIAIAVHFTLQRRFVWRHQGEFALPLGRQTGRYLPVVAAQYVVTAASTSLLPSALGAPTEVVYLATVTIIICANFLVFRHLIFHAAPARGRGTSVPDRAPRPHQERARADVTARSSDRTRPGPAAIVDAAIATLAVLLVASPVLFTHDGFSAEFTNALWTSNYQEHAIAAHFYPTLFLQTEQGVFYPFFAFYGGTLFALTGALGVLLGGATILAFETMIVIAIAAAYGGLFWLARQLGVRGMLAHAPAVVYVTSAYYIADLYGRGDWTEFTAVSMLPLVVAAALRIARGPLRFAPAACLVAATTIFSGSHNLTLLWGTTLTVIALAVYWLLSGLPRQLPWRGILTATGLIALGIALNAWFLLPDLRYAYDTAISSEFDPQGAAQIFDAPSLIFDPLRAVPGESSAPGLFVQIPVLALAWGLLALPLVWHERRLRAGVVTALAALAGLLVLIVFPGVYTHLPNTWKELQMTYRLQTYVTLACAGLVLLGTLAITRRAQRTGPTPAGRLYTLGLGLVLAFGLALAAWQLWVPNTHLIGHPNYSVRARAITASTTVLPTSWFWPNDLYNDRSLHVVPTSATIAFNPRKVSDDRIAASATFPAGTQPFATNIVGGPYLVHVGGGVHVVGRTDEGDIVLKRNTSGSQAVPVEVRAQLSAPVLAGRIVTIASAVVLLALALAAIARGRLAPAKQRRTETHTP